jgi:hypothetical protein
MYFFFLNRVLCISRFPHVATLPFGLIRLILGSKEIPFVLTVAKHGSFVVHVLLEMKGSLDCSSCLLTKSMCGRALTPPKTTSTLAPLKQQFLKWSWILLVKHLAEWFLLFFFWMNERCQMSIVILAIWPVSNHIQNIELYLVCYLCSWFTRRDKSSWWDQL